MAERRVAIVACLALVAGCSRSAPSSNPTSTHLWTAVGVPASAVPASPAVTLIRSASSGSAETPPRTSRAQPWASGPGAPSFPLPSSVDQHSADAVALAGARALASADTAVDPRPQHTAVRAALAGWLTPTYGHEQLAATITAATTAQWNTWTRHHAYVVVTARLSGDDHPPDTVTAAARMVLLTERPIGRDGWRGSVTTTVVAVVLKKINGNWRIDNEFPG